jgi:hypothetical protein
MLNILITVLLLNVTVISFFFTFKINRIEQIFTGLNATFISTSVKLNDYTEKYYFDKEDLVDLTSTYFKINLQNFNYKLKFAFREDDLNTTISECPNIVQIDIYATILFEDVYKSNVRFYLDGRKVSKDWFASL